MRSPAGHTRYENVCTADWEPVSVQMRTLAESAVNVQHVGLPDKPDLDPNRGQLTH
jgi:hypothetical protein